MELDFSKLLGDAQKRPERTFDDSSDEKHYKEGKSVYRANTGDTGGLLAVQYIQEQEEREKILQVYQEYQSNIKKSEELRAEILSGVKNGEPPADLLLKACKCISLMTGDTLFYNQIERNIEKAQL